ncbi:MAG: esterase-like activity of phytase family protein [Methylomonas sp.]|jgi:hypothetical protein|uniref:esterase-like activity of phytase family protein n=1 Tax=Methylomonas sp. TaxID=418 RepID=UPI0025E84291|nr:esterase-like activity of phytase family protein [Methylomonas sp.]MCK9605690.1 esterase-like activity of phytase family protein [Methylomonas sp.]
MTHQRILPVLIVSLLASSVAMAEIELIAIGKIDGSLSDRNRQTAAPLENAVQGNLLGGIGSGLAYAGGNSFLALPDRGPNATAYNPLVDDTVSYINRFQTVNLNLAHNRPGADLPFKLMPVIKRTTLLSSSMPLVYGDGIGLNLGAGEPALNAKNRTHYFTGRSDNFDPAQVSTDASSARLDPEAIRMSCDGKSVFISDEYGPYVYQFDRQSGKRIKTFNLPVNLAIEHLSAQKSEEIANNTVGRVTNKGMEGLAITPDCGKLVGIMQANLEQDKKKSLRIVTIDIDTEQTHEYAYKLTDGSGVSEIVAINDHQFLVDERDGNGFADTPLLTDTASAALVKKLYLIDLDGAQDISSVEGPNADLTRYAVTKDPAPFLDIVSALNAAGIDSRMIPSKLEGLAFGQDVTIKGVKKHTLVIANDNDFLADVADPLTDACAELNNCERGTVANPNQFYVFAFDDNDLPGYQAQQIRKMDQELAEEHEGDHHEHHQGLVKALGVKP